MMKPYAFSFLFALVASTLLAGCGNGTDAAGKHPENADAPSGGRVLNVYNWSDYIAEGTIRDFEARTGIKVNYTVYTNNDALTQQLAAKPDAFDVIFPSAQPYAKQMIAAGALAPLDSRKLGNLKHLDQAILRELAAFDPGNAHVVPYMWGTTGIGINVDKVRAVLGPGAALDTWGLIFDPANAAKLSSCGIAIMDNELETFPAALLWKGMDPNDYSVEAGEAVRRAFSDIRPHVRKFTNDSELIDGLADGSFCVTMSFSGDVQQAQAKAEEQAEAAGNPAPRIRYVIPREGAMRWIDVVAIPAKAKNKDNAHLFLQYLMEPQVIAEISNHVAYANGNTAATPLLEDAIAEDPGIYPPAEVRAKLQTVRSPDEAEAAQRKTIWNTILYGWM